MKKVASSLSDFGEFFKDVSIPNQSKITLKYGKKIILSVILINFHY